MRRSAALLAIALLGTELCACGGSTGATGTQRASTRATTTGSETGPGSVPPAPYPKADSDKDNDVTAPYDDRSNQPALSYGHRANAADTRAVTVVVKRYYAAALAGDGAKACSTLYMTLVESVAENSGRPPGGPAYMLGAKNCPQAMTLLFKHFHAPLAAEVPKLRVSQVRLVEHRGYAMLTFGALPEREIPVAREGHTWKIEAIYDTELP